MKNLKFKRGQALVSLLFFMIIAIAITTTAVVVTVTTAQSTSLFERTDVAYSIAEAGAETAILRYMRNSSYTGETFPLEQGIVTVQVSGANPITIVSEGRLGGILRKVQVQALNINNIFSITSWKEIL